MKPVLHLTLTYHWFDEIAAGRKTIEYRAIKTIWKRRILNNYALRSVVFHRGYTSRTLRVDVNYVDVGPCPYNEWPDDYIRIHFISPSPYIDNPAL